MIRKTIYEYPQHLEPYFNELSDNDTHIYLTIILDGKKAILRLMRKRNNKYHITGLYETDDGNIRTIPDPQNPSNNFSKSSTNIEDLDVWLSMNFPFIRDYGIE